MFSLSKALFCLLISSKFLYCDEDTVTDSSSPQAVVDDKISDISMDQMKQVGDSGEKHEFQAEVDRMMKLIINSLYTNKEIFLRELISNSSDALEKIQFVALQNPDEMKTNPELGIWIKADPIAQTITLRDSGVGMTKEELIKNLGTLAKSGTSDFIKTMQNDTGSGNTDMNSMIGQFGVGFYSAFLVADRVTVISKHNTDDQYIWQSDASSFTIAKDTRGNTLGRGTQVILHLREEAAEFLESARLTDMIRKYSEFIDFKIYLKKEMKDEDKSKSETSTSDSGVKVTKTQESGDDKNATEESEVGYKLMNEVKPIWMRPPKEVTEDEYSSFYSTIVRKTNSTPLLTVHFSAEGETSFRALMFVPKELNQQFFTAPEDMTTNMKLYVRRVFISDTTRTTLPKYLWFLVGVLDSDDLPLNVGRESLQQSPLNKVMKKRIVRKFIDYLSKLEDAKFLEFWKEFSLCIKMGVMEDNFNQHRLMKITRFPSSQHPSNLTTLADYISRMKKGQQEIFYIAGPKRDELEKSPLVQKILRRKYEVIFMVDTIDEYMMQHLQDFDGKRFQNVAKDGFKLPKGERSTKKHAKLEEEYNPLFTWYTSSKDYKDRVTSVRISERTDSAPCLLISDRYGFTGNLHRLVQAQTYSPLSKDETFKARDRRHLEVNPKHPMIKNLLKLISEDKESDQTKELAKSCYTIASLSSGYTVENSLDISELLETLTVRSIGLDPNTVAETIQQETEEEIEDEEEDEEDIRKNDPANAKPEGEESTSTPEDAPAADETSTTDSVEKDEL